MSAHSRRIAAALLLALAIVAFDMRWSGVLTQSVDRLEFDAASVKRQASDDGPRGISFSPSGRFAWSRMTLRQLMQSAFVEVDFREIVGGPRWVDQDRFDIVATSPEALRELTPDGQPRGLFARLRTLLEDRFKLKTHLETREIPVYALRPVSVPMRPGPGLQLVSVDCAAVAREVAGGRRREAVSDGPPPCALQVGPGQLIGHAITMGRVAGSLSGVAGRPIVDRTGLTGTFDVNLKWTPEPQGAVADAPASLTYSIPLFTAVREQLGLRLEAARDQLPVLVIDEAQPPDPD